MLYAELLERCDLVSFLEAHQRAFASFGGVPREILYDRMRNVYLKRLHGQPPLFSIRAALREYPDELLRYSPFVPLN